MYLRKAALMREYDVSARTVDYLIALIQEYIGKRYPPGAMIHTGRIVRIRDDVFDDAIHNRDRILTGCASDFVPHERHAWDKKEAAPLAR
ncbi:MAG: hypothetical protein ACOYBC_05365 [Bilifractor sp.]|jgi:hypothetical protein